jgi:hypothetical protein
MSATVFDMGTVSPSGGSLLVISISAAGNIRPAANGCQFVAQSVAVPQVSAKANDSEVRDE